MKLKVLYLVSMAFLMLLAIAGRAHAADAAVPAAGVDWGFWLGLIAAIGTSVSLFLHWLAPRTKTTVDDTIRDDLDEALAFVRSFQGKPSDSPSVRAETAPGKGSAAMLTVLLLGGLAVGQSGCAASQRESTIKAAMVTVDAAQKAYVIHDADAQDKIVKSATSSEDGKAKLAAYRLKRERVVKAFVAAYQAIATGAQLSDDRSLASIASAAVEVIAAVKDLTGGAQ